MKNPLPAQFPDVIPCTPERSQGMTAVTRGSVITSGSNEQALGSGRGKDKKQKDHTIPQKKILFHGNRLFFSK